MKVGGNMLTINNFRGVDKSKDPTQLEPNQAQDMLNMITDNYSGRGAIMKRRGYAKESGMLDGDVRAVVPYTKYPDKFIATAGAKIYAGTDPKLTGATVIHTYGITPSVKEKFVEMNGKLYIFTGEQYLQYDNVSVVEVSTVATIPTIVLGAAPAGGGTAFQQINLLQPYVIHSVSGDGTATLYQLPLTGLDVSPITASIDGGLNYDKVETTHFTVNRTTGQLTWITAPPTGTNNVKIKFARTFTGFADRINKCVECSVFGGTNDTRVFASRGDNIDYRSDLYDPTYFPENGFTKIGSDNTFIRGYTRIGETQLILKNDIPNETTIWARSYDFNGGNPLFPIKPVADSIGCVGSYSIQSINGMPVFLSKKGVYGIVGTAIKDERNLQPLSRPIDADLLTYSSTFPAIYLSSIDYKGKYILNVGDKTFVWDYIANEWFIWVNFTAFCFLEFEDMLYFGGRGINTKYVYKFDFINGPATDDGVPFTGYWMSKIFNLDSYNFYKQINEVKLTCMPQTDSQVNIAIIPESNTGAYADYQTFNIADFTNPASPQTRGSLARERVISFCLLLSATGAKTMELINIDVNYVYHSKVR